MFKFPSFFLTTHINCPLPILLPFKISYALFYILFSRFPLVFPSLRLFLMLCLFFLPSFLSPCRLYVCVCSLNTHGIPLFEFFWSVYCVYVFFLFWIHFVKNTLVMSVDDSEILIFELFVITLTVVCGVLVVWSCRKN
jgi:hypothetical protein